MVTGYHLSSTKLENRVFLSYGLLTITPITYLCDKNEQINKTDFSG